MNKKCAYLYYSMALTDCQSIDLAGTTIGSELTSVPCSMTSLSDLFGIDPNQSPSDNAPPGSPTFSWPSDLGSNAFSTMTLAPFKHEKALLLDDISASNNPSPTMPLLTSLPPSAPPSPTSPTIQQIRCVMIPSGHYMVTFNSVILTLTLPCDGTHGCYYLIMQGRLVTLVTPHLGPIRSIYFYRCIYL